MRIDEGLVRRLIAAQFPQWVDLQIEAVWPGGWDNRTFRLGERMVVRLPSAAVYAAQVDREQKWLPRLAPFLPVPIPSPVAMGEPTAEYPWHWSVFLWLDGDPVKFGPLEDQTAFATEVAEFLNALHRADAAGGPSPGPENFFRGGALETYDAEVHQSIDVLGKSVDAAIYAELWNNGLTARWDGSPVWVHGDFSASNLLARAGQLCGVIDFGQCCVGDPACDLAIAWTLFDSRGRGAFRNVLSPDPGTWARGRAWAIWNALIVAAGLTDTNAGEKAQALLTLGSVLADC